MTTRIRRTMCTLVAGAAVLGAVAGCSNAAPSGVDPAAHEQSEHAGHGTHSMPGGEQMSDQEMSGHGHGGGLALWATQKSGGTVMVTDGDGRPLYRSNADGANPARPNCAGACTAEWEPVTLAAGQTPELLGVQRSAIGSVRRADGAMQLTLGGAPLYRHAGAAVAQPDPRKYTADGWYVVNPRGDRVLG